MATFEAIALRVGKNIKTLRIERRLTQGALAQACKFEKATMSRIESGDANITIATLHRLAVALDVDVADLVKK